MTWAINNTIITQSGTDTDLSGLSAISGITTKTYNALTVYDMSNYELVITGTLTHDPDTEVLAWSLGNGVGPMMRVTGTYNYGKERTANGNTIYSNNTGIICVNVDTGGGGREWNVTNRGLIQNDGGTINMYGGAIASGKPFGLAGGNVGGTSSSSSTINIKNTKIYRPSGLSSSERREIRFDDNTNSILGSVENLIVDGFLVTHRNLPSNFSVTLLNGAICQLALGPASSTLRDLNTSDNIRTDYDLGTDDYISSTQELARFYTVINASEGSNTRCMPKEGVGNSRQLGGAIIQKEVSFNVRDSSGSAISGVKVYTKDTDNSYRKNANGQDHTADKVYEATTDVNGDTGTLTITTAITNIDSKGSSSTTPVNYALWDTTSDSNRYKVDRRGLDDSGDDIFAFVLIEYEKLIYTTNQPLKGVGELSVDWIMLNDPSITDTYVSAKALTQITDSNKFYDRAKAYLVDNFAGENATIVTRDGVTIDAGSYDVTIDNSAVQPFSLSANTITIKSSSFTGNITTSGNVTLTGTINYVGTITDASGTRSFGSYQIKNLVNGSRVQVYNTTTGVEIYNAVVNATNLTEGFTNTGGTAMNANDSMRVRVTYQNGATAKEPQELLATCQYPTWEVSANQIDATQYNNYSVDGSTIAEFSLDIGAGKIEVDIDDTDNSTTVQRVASWYYAELMEPAGISDLFGAIEWIEDNEISIDQSKVDLLLDNVKAVPLILKGGRLYRLDGTTIIASTSNSIQIDYAPVYIANAPLIEKIDKNTKLIPALL